VDLDHQRAVFERAAGRLPGSARVVRAHGHADRTTDRLRRRARGGGCARSVLGGRRTGRWTLARRGCRAS
jgi:hypothetical protein